MKYLDGLNDEQKEAVLSTEGYIRVIAGAGSGKTRALTHRFAYIVDMLGISTSNILCVTFTNKAANEMKKRVRSLIGDNDLGLICTFHGFCVQVLRDDISKINFPRNFIILDEEDVKGILKTVYKTCNISSNEITINSAKDYIHEAKSRIRTNEYIKLFAQTSDSELFDLYEKATSTYDKIFFGYIYEQRKNYGLDFDDLILLTLHIFNISSDVLNKWQNKLEYIMVDEFQDVSVRQYQLCSMLSQKHKNLFVVGDPDQTIYSWRGANVYYFLNFDRDFANTKTIIMNKNYRSSANIISTANSLIKKNSIRIEKDLVPIKSEQVKPLYYHAKTVFEESDWIAKQVLALKQSGKKFSDIAILYRAHFVSRPIEESFMRYNIPYYVYSGVGFYNRKEIKDILCYLRMLTSSDDISFLRTVNEPRRNIGEKRISALKDYAKIHHCSLYDALKSLLNEKLFIESKAAEYVNLIERCKQTYSEKSVTDLLKTILIESGYEEMLKVQGDEDRLSNLAELAQSITEYEDSANEDFSLEDYLSKIALFTNEDREKANDSVKLMTIHTSKGLEFPYVFICGLNEGIFPSRKQNTIEKLEEERRLAYVAFTRAEEILFLSEAEGLNYDNSFRYPSRFIFNVDASVLDFRVPLDEKMVSEATDYIQHDENIMHNINDNSTYLVGDRVKHEVFGSGTIVEIDNENNSLIIKFDSLDTNRSIGMKAHITHE